MDILKKLISKSLARLIVSWMEYEETIVEHIIKILIIQDEYAEGVWYKEIHTHLIRLQRMCQREKLTDRFYARVTNQMLPQGQENIKTDTILAVKHYLYDDSNFKQRAWIRPSSVVEIRETVEQILPIFIKYVKENRKEQYLQSNKDLQKIVKQFHKNKLSRMIKDIKEIKKVIQGV